MKTFWKKLKSETTLEKIIVRIIMAWILTSLCFFVKSDGNFATALYTDKINTIMYVCYILLFFVSFCALGFFKAFTWVETFGPTILITIYGILSVQADTELSYVMGLMVVLAVTIMYAINKTRVFVEIKKKWAVVVLYILAAVFYMGIVGGVSIFRYLTYNSGNDEFTALVQLFHNLRSGSKPVTDFSLIYYIFLPVYCIFPYPLTLLVMQIITVLSGIIPMYLLCRKLNLSKSATVAFGIIYVLYPALACGCYADLHENCFLIPLLLWLFYFIEKDDLKMIIILSALSLLVKEDAVIYVGCIGLYLLIGRKKYAKGAILTVGSIIYYVIIVIVMKKSGGLEITKGYENYIVDGNGTILDVIHNFIVNPGYVVQKCFSQEKLQFLFFMFLPVGFMPVCSKKISKFILLLPMIFINLAPDFSEKYSIFSQYAFGAAAILIYLSVSNYSEMEEKTRKYLCAIAISASLVFLPTGALSKTEYAIDYMNNYEQYKLLDEAIADIPKNASVTASKLFSAHVANRTNVYEYPSDELSDIIILDSRNNKYDSRVIKGFLKKGYTVVDEEKDLYVILGKENIN